MLEKLLISAFSSPLNVIFVYSWATFYLIYFTSNIIREIFVEDHVQQGSTSIKEILRDLNLLCHARDFEFLYVASTMACENIRVCSKVFCIATGSPESQQHSGSQIIRICMEIYLKIDKTVKMYKNSY